ncbi:hypothetical protein IPR78_19675 [Xanthomonas perforans]|nr:hypothetical protein [Xanthomonas perforans]MBZ2690767.1 hypothetical protein [Xanthomonas perforans]MBZ2707972.1 hypothetical protein [Xanthomonas perforans]MBZ2822827.1 hypothetical protein [Xanthomonas perforans]MBZ2839399.1 hypothetical protein [Xanthomonas perforans]
MDRYEQLSDQDKGEMNRWLDSPGRVVVADALLEEILLSNADPIEAKDLEMLDCWIEKYGSVCDSWVLEYARERWP